MKEVMCKGCAQRYFIKSERDSTIGYCAVAQEKVGWFVLTTSVSK